MIQAKTRIQNPPYGCEAYAAMDDVTGMGCTSAIACPQDWQKRASGALCAPQALQKTTVVPGVLTGKLYVSFDAV